MNPEELEDERHLSRINERKERGTMYVSFSLFPFYGFNVLYNPINNLIILIKKKMLQVK